MIRGTTPTLEFVLPLEMDSVKELYITMQQLKETVIEKKLEDCKSEKNYDGEGSMITCKLTQEETLRLIQDKDVEIQLRIKTMEGNALASNIITVRAERILKEGVI